KDATFNLHKVQDRPLLYAFELYHYPSWFIKHNKKKKFAMTLGHVKGSAKHVTNTAFFIKHVRCKHRRKNSDDDDLDPDGVNDDLNNIEIPQDDESDDTSSDTVIQVEQDHVATTGFTPCDKTCGGGIRLRMIKVNNRQVLQRRACNTHKCP
ncbi:hypothetical protein QZH41_015351, partial [Actinostola sp. cb2023]